jgi:exonuclease III
MSSTSTLEMANNFQNTRLKIAHLNIRSLKSNTHLTQLRDLARRENFDILTISETWLNTSVSSAEVRIDRYNLF